MKRSLLGTTLALALGLSVACAPASEGPDPAAMIAAANELDEAFVTAFNNGDAEALSQLYGDGPDVVYYPPDVMEARGLAAIRDANQAFLAATPGATLELTPAGQMAAGDFVIGWRLWHMTIPGMDEPRAGRCTDVKAERDGRWVYIVDHASAPVPPPADASTTSQ